MYEALEAEAKELYAELTKILGQINAAMHTPGGIGVDNFNALQDRLEEVGDKLETVSDAMSEARN